MYIWYFTVLYNKTKNEKKNKTYRFIALSAIKTRLKFTIQNISK